MRVGEMGNLHTVDDDLGLYLVDIPVDSFLYGMLMDDTSIRMIRPGSTPHGAYEMNPWWTGAYFIQWAFYGRYLG